MMVRTTTKEIQELANYYDKNSALQEHSFFKKEWVCLVDLQKTIENEINNIKELDVKQPIAINYKEGLLDSLIWINKLCNSSEQKKCTCPCFSEEDRKYIFKKHGECVCGRCGGAL